MAQEGWVCPRCDKVNAPWVDHCDCSNTVTVIVPDDNDNVTCTANVKLEDNNNNEQMICS